jgi:hypothetical protein
MLTALLLAPVPARAQERLCDNSFEDCRAHIISMIRAERVGIDVSFWFMTDWRYASELAAAKRNYGVKVRVLLDLRADGNYPAGVSVRQTLIDAGIPIRHKSTDGINHWKMMLYAGQRKVHFSAANFASGSYSYTQIYTNYVDEAIYFTDDDAIVNRFMMRYDDNWTNTVDFQNLANVTGPLVRHYPNPIQDISPDLNFLPDESFTRRVVSALRRETVGIDAIIFRITAGDIPVELIARHNATPRVPVRLITDRQQYRNPTFYWHSYNIDRMYVAGIPLKWKNDFSGQDMHQKSLVLHGQQMAIFGSSNWTSSSGTTQEHNYFTPTHKLWMWDWFMDQFRRKWNNLRPDGTPQTNPTMYLDFVPGYPESPVVVSPANAAGGQTLTTALRWEGGWWAHKYDIYFGTTNPPPLVAQDFMPGSNTAGVRSTKESFNPCTPPAPFVSSCSGGLQAGVTYYWRIRSKTMVGNSRAVMGSVWSFTTTGGAPVPASISSLRATSVSSTSVGLAWDDVANEQGYRIERKLASASSTAWVEFAVLGANVTARTDTGLLASTSYNYRVRAYNASGNSPYSNVLVVSTAAPSPDAGRVVADTFVRDGAYASTPYGTAAELVSKFSSDPQYYRITFMKLNLSSLQAGQRVTLRVTGRLSDTRAASVSAGVYAVSNVTWSEGAVTWSSRPATATTPITTLTVSGTAARTYDIDLMSYAQAERAAGRTTIAIAIKSTVDTLPYIGIFSRESTQPPLLMVGQ